MGGSENKTQILMATLETTKSTAASRILSCPCLNVRIYFDVRGLTVTTASTAADIIAQFPIQDDGSRRVLLGLGGVHFVILLALYFLKNYSK